MDEQESREEKGMLLLYASPLAFLMEQAGGAAVSYGEPATSEPLRTRVPSHTRERAAIVWGSGDDISELCEYLV